MDITWLVIANASKAKVYSFVYLNRGLKRVAEMDHPENTLKEHDLVTDRPGHYQVQGGLLRGVYGEDYSAKETNLEKSAKELMAWLDKARMTHKYTTLVMVAPPHYLGLLKKNMSKSLETLLQRTISKDLVRVPEHELREVIAQEFAHS